jgi:4-hydroxy-tetrahydrodipicolinate synthase
MLSSEERNSIISTTISTLKGKIPVIVGCGTVSHTQTLTFMREAEALGADATLVVAPYYVKPSQDGIVAYFKSLHDQTQLPIIVYNNPGRVGVNIEVETVARLCSLPRILGFKDSHSDATRIAALRSRVGHRMSLLSGDDSILAAQLLYGADGAISVLANVVPDLCKQQMDAWFNGNMNEFKQLSSELLPLTHAISLETNPCGIKYAVSRLGYCTDEVRLPLLPTSATTQKQIGQECEKIRKIPIAA